MSDSRNQEIGDSRNQEIRRQGFEKSLPVLNADVPASLGAAGAAPGVRHELGPDEKAPCVLAGENVYGPLRPDAASVRELLQRIKDDRGPAQG